MTNDATPTTTTTIPASSPPAPPAPLVKRGPAAEEHMAKVHAERQKMLREELERTATQRLPLAQLDESPFNKRRTWGDLEELAASLKSVGFLQDLIARPHPKKQGRFEVVFGHRRLRAGKLAKLEDAPVKVRELSDDQVVELQAIENLQRTDVHEIEEAETFELLKAKQRLSVEDLAAKVGKSVAYVYARLKLLALCEDARKAFVEGRITASVALYVARIPHEKLQKQALKELVRGKDQDPIGARHAFAIVDQRYMLRLADAPFDQKDAKLVPEAGSCSDCPKRTGNQRELFADVGSDNVCTDPLCYESKKKAHVERERDRLKTTGVRVVAGRKGYGDDILVPEGYEELERKHYDYSSKAVDNKTHGQILKAAGVERERVVMIDAKGKTVELVPRGQLQSAIRKLKPKSKASKGSTSSSSKYTDAEEKALEELRKEVWEELKKKIAAKPGSDAAWRTLGFLLAFHNRAAWPKLSGPKLVAAVLEEVGDYRVLEGGPVDDTDDELHAIAKAFDVDLAKREKEALYEAQKVIPMTTMPARDAKAVAKAAKSIPAKEIAKAAKQAKAKASKGTSKGRKK